MIPFWLTFTDGSQGCCEGETVLDAKQIAEKLTGKVVAGGTYQDIAGKRLPYPARPVIWQLDHPVHGRCPPLCSTPKKCAGRSACPKSYACSE